MSELGDNSRFNTTQSIIVDGKETLGRWSEPRFLTQPVAESDIYAFKVDNRYEGRPDVIADILYDASDLAWVLIAFNQVRDPMNWPRAGDVIKYPDRAIVFSELFG